VEGRVYNFSAGPATLPLPVLEKVQGELLAYPGAGASVMEISHRSKAFAEIHAGAKANIAKLLDLPEGYHVLFLQGGASLQFSMLAMNFLQGGAADYVQSGSWANKAMGEAKKHGTVNTAWSGKADNFVRMPKPAELALTDGAAYVHFTSNETIQGITMYEEPETNGVPLFCDASSDFLSRPLDMSKYAMLYAGAQKNVGPAGTAVVIIRDDMLEKGPEGLPSLLDYKLMADNDSLYNTPSCFIIYIIGEVTRWVLEEFGGLAQMAAHNEKKAALIYDLIDGSGGYYRGHAEQDSRSMMNVAFRLPSEELEAKFIAESKAAGLDGLKGHRSVGGCRASIYNAMPLAGCEALRDFMTAFQKANG